VLIEEQGAAVAQTEGSLHFWYWRLSIYSISSASTIFL